MIGSIGSIGGNFRPPSPAEMSEKMFGKIDGDSDGNITKDELEKLLTDSSGDTSSVDDIIGLFDSDQDGNITKAEFSSVMEQMDPHNRDQSGTQDSDQGSTIKTLLDALDSSRANEIKQELFDKADTDGDGSISESEFETLIDELEKNSEQNRPVGPPPGHPPGPPPTEENSSLFELAQQSYSNNGAFSSEDYIKELLSGLSWSA
jgi:Ca2+-binding EF-hand superfamily protein